MQLRRRAVSAQNLIMLAQFSALFIRMHEWYLKKHHDHFHIVPRLSFTSICHFRASPRKSHFYESKNWWALNPPLWSSKIPYSEAHEMRPRPNTPIPRNPNASLDHLSKAIVWLLDKNFVRTSHLHAFHVSHFSPSSPTTFREWREEQSLKCCNIFILFHFSIRPKYCTRNNDFRGTKQLHFLKKRSGREWRFRLTLIEKLLLCNSRKLWQIVFS
jgi:hypothetical protein